MEETIEITTALYGALASCFRKLDGMNDDGGNDPDPELELIREEMKKMERRERLKAANPLHPLGNPCGELLLMEPVYAPQKKEQRRDADATEGLAPGSVSAAGMERTLVIELPDGTRGTYTLNRPISAYSNGMLSMQMKGALKKFPKGSRVINSDIPKHILDRVNG